MTGGSDDSDIFIRRQEEEARLNWSRNYHFLLMFSLFFLAYSSARYFSLTLASVIMIVASGFGVFSSVVWCKIEKRSSDYIKYYKKQAEDLRKKAGKGSIYPSKNEVRGIEMRILVLAFPAGFFVFWLVLLVTTIVSIYW